MIVFVVQQRYYLKESENNMMQWECIECEKTYIDQIDGCVGERMCYDCLDKDDELLNKENVK